MNKRTIVLISICCLLAVATLTIRYIEQEIAVIKAKFVGGKQTEERSPRSVSSSRPVLPGTPQVQTTAPPAKQDERMPALSNPVAVPPDVTTIPAGVPSPSRPAFGAGKPVTATPAVVGGKQAEEADAPREEPATTVTEDVTTPFGPEESAELPDSGPEPERAGGADMEEAVETAAEEKNVSAAETEDAGAVAGADEKSDEAAEEEAVEETDRAEDDAVIPEGEEEQEEEITEEGEPFVGEEAADGDQAPAEEEILQDEEDAAEQTEEGVDEE